MYNILVFFSVLVLSEPAECQATDFTVQGNSLTPLMRPGQDGTFKSPDCISIHRGDLAIIDTRANDLPIIKQINGIPGDTMKLIASVSGNSPYRGRRYTIEINGHAVIAPNGNPYILYDQGYKLLRLYEGKLRGYLVLGNPGTLDSSRIGVLDSSSIVGIVER